MEYLLHEQTSERLLFRPLEKTDWDSWLPFFKSPMAMKHWPTGTFRRKNMQKNGIKNNGTGTNKAGEV